MAVDTARKRISALQVGRPYMQCTSIVDGAIDQNDRQLLAWTYSGILAGSIVLVYGNILDVMRQRLEAATGDTDSVDDMWHTYLVGQLGHDGQINDLQFEWLGTQGQTGKQIQDRERGYLISLGYVGGMQDMFYQAWSEGAYI